MLNFQRLKTLFYLHKGCNKASPTLTFYPLSPLSLKYSTVTLESDQNSFTVSYLIHNIGFSPETARNVSKRVRFKTPQKPDSVVAFFKNNGFPDSHIHRIIRTEPWLLSCNPQKRLLPKFEFLLSKGASTSDIIYIFSFCPRFLRYALQNNIIPIYKLLKGFLQTDEKVVSCIKRYPHFVTSQYMACNLKLLCDNGVNNSNIALLLSSWPRLLCSSTPDLMVSLEEIKELEFDPLKSSFVYALIAKKSVTKSKWDAKVAVLKSWGWSQENIVEAFRRHPKFMLASEQKISTVISFWVDQLCWSSLALAEMPSLFGYSLEKRIIPRASVVKYLHSKGLKNKGSSLRTPFFISEKLFLEKFVKCFEEEASHILKLYQEKMNL